MKNFILLFALLSAGAAQAATSEADKAALLITKNYMTNGGAESGKAGWTPSGTSAVIGDLAISTGAANVYEGTSAFTWTPANADNYLTNTSVTITSGGGLSGLNCAAIVWTKTTATTHALEAYDGSNVLASATVPASTIFQPVVLNWPCSTSGTNTVRWNAGATTAISFDSGKWGDARGFNLGSITNTTAWTSYTMTIGGSTTPPTKGTIVRDQAQWRRVGDSMEIAYDFEQSGTGTAGSGTYLFPLPSGYTIDSTKVSLTNDGSVAFGQASTSQSSTGMSSVRIGVVTAYNSTNLALALHNDSGAPTNARSLLSDGIVPLSGATVTFTFRALVPITGWTAETAFRTDQTPASWSGYHDDTCSWARTNASYGDPTADTTCTLTESYNRNMGTVTSYLSGSDKLPGLVFTPSRAGRYEVCAMVAAGGATAGQDYSLQLTDGSISGPPGKGWSQDTAGYRRSTPLCGIFNLSVAATTIKVQSKGSSGAITIAAPSSGTGTAIDWTVKALDFPMPTPLLVGGVTSNTSGLERIERAKLTCSGASAIVSQSGSWISSIGNISTGACTVTIAAGIFSAAPSCFMTADNQNGTIAFGAQANVVSSTSVIVTGAYNSAGTTTTTTSWTPHLLCMGPR